MQTGKKYILLIPKDEDGFSSDMYGSYYNLDGGSITNGDDLAWIGDPDVMMSGEWRYTANAV